MTERILIEGSVDPPLLGQVHALANGIKRVGEESEKLAGAAAQGTRQLGEETAKAAQSTDRLGVSLRGVGEAARHLNEIREAAVAFGEAALGAVRGVAELAGEQQRLNANSARLGLNFAQSARGAGGFVTELQTMQLATALANRNLRVTQGELDTLARVGMARARDSGQEVSQVFEGMGDALVEGGEELGKFGQELLTVADDSHTASDRLGALVQSGRNVAPTMRTAADEVAAFESSLRSAGRYVSTGFVEEMSRLSQLTGQTRGIRTDAEEARRELEAMGRAAAFVLRGVADLAGIVVGAVAVSVRGLTGMMQGVAEAVRTRSFDGLRTGTAGAADDIRGILGFIDARVASLGALSADAGPRTTAASGPAAAAAQASDLVVTSQEEGRDPVTGRALRPANDNAGGGGGGTTRSDARLTEIDARLAAVRQMSTAEREARFGVKVATVAGIITRTEDEVLRVQEERVAALRAQMTERRSGESGNDRRQRIAQLETQVSEAQQEIRAESVRRATEGVRGFVAAQAPAREQYQARSREIADLTRQQEATDQAVRDREAAASAEAFARSPAGQQHAVAQMRADLEREHAQGAAMERERAQTEERLRVQESFTEQWERLHRRQASATTAMVDVANGAITTFGQALGKHINLVMSGQESIGEGALNMVGEVVTAIGQEAIVKSAMELAEGIAAAAGVLTAPLAPGHFAAAAAFGAVGVAALGAGAIMGAARGSGGASSAAAAPALPPPTQQDAAASEGGRSITIIYGAGILGSPRDLARHVRDVLEEGEQAGVRLPSRVVERAA